MKLTTTIEKKILLFIYNELSNIESLEVKQLLQTNANAKLHYLSLVDSCKQLDTLWENPHNTSVKIISETANKGYSETV